MSLLFNLTTMAALFLVGSAFEALSKRASGDSRRVLYGLAYITFEAGANVVAVFCWVGIAEMTGVYRLIDVPIVSSGLLGSLFALLLLMFSADLLLYWMHRAQHASALLWRGHALHHSDRDVGVTSTTRLHLIDLLGRHVFFTIPFPILFGLPRPEYSIMLLIPTIWIYFIHLNINISFGRLWWLLTSPQYHRVHHSIEVQHHNKNFAAFFPFWDICFGTAYNAPEHVFPDGGTHQPDVQSLADYFTYPILPFWSAARRAKPD